MIVRNRSSLLFLSILALLLAALLLAISGAEADEGPVVWKAHCPRHHDLQTVVATDWGGVHALCVRSAADEKLAISGAEADEGPVVWKAHCPRHHDLQTVVATDWGGVHALCVRSAVTEKQ